MGALDDLFADLLSGGDIQRTATPGDSGDIGDKQASMRVCDGFEVGDKLATSGDKLPGPVGLSPNVATLSPMVNRQESEQRRHLSPMSPLSPGVRPAVLSPTPARTCVGCLHLLRRGTCGEPVAAGLLTAEEGFGIVWPPEGHGAACQAFAGKLPAKALERPYRPTKEQGDAAHCPAWDDAEIATFTGRVQLFLRRGVNPADSEDLAERLTLRDRQHDDRRLCLECSHLGERGRCLAAAAGRLPGADRRLEPVPTTLQRCKAFGLRKGQP